MTSKQVQNFQFFLIVLSTCTTLTNVQSARAAFILSTRNEFITARSPNSPNTPNAEGLGGRTIVAIVFGLSAYYSVITVVFFFWIPCFADKAVVSN